MIVISVYRYAPYISHVLNLKSGHWARWFTASGSHVERRCLRYMGWLRFSGGSWFGAFHIGILFFFPRVSYLVNIKSFDISKYINPRYQLPNYPGTACIYHRNPSTWQRTIWLWILSLYCRILIRVDIHVISLSNLIILASAQWCEKYLP